MPQIDMSEIKRRSKKLFELVNETSFSNNEKWIGWEGLVLFDEISDGQIKGRNYAYKPIFVKEPVTIGQKNQVRIVDVTNHSLIGEVIS